RETIEKAIAQLPEEQRVVLHLRLREDLTHEEIARIVGVPTATVTSRLFLARKKLEQLLRNERVS
ncbi:MAG TPA: sigma-70 family RNA polymerase sigma factor, partial [Planctomycetota bacterium]|nr:sigma-70 family RNA polymerase sigma factor [Planctomycetota bacterium]